MPGIICNKCCKNISPTANPISKDFCHLCEDFHFDLSKSLCVYDGLAKKIVLAIKNDNTIHAKTIAILLYRKFQNILQEEKTLITVVPSSPKSVRERMYSQLALITKQLKKIDKNLVINNFLLTKKIETPKQSSLSKKARSTNLDGAFGILDMDIIQKFEKFIVIDDVMTTGNTFSEVAKTIKKEKPRAEVICIAFCSTDF